MSKFIFAAVALLAAGAAVYCLARKKTDAESSVEKLTDDEPAVSNGADTENAEEFSEKTANSDEAECNTPGSCDVCEKYGDCPLSQPDN